MRPQARPEPEVDPSTLEEFGPYIDADTLDPRGNQLVSPTGTGIGQPSTSTFDYTGVNMGELGRGAPEGTLPPDRDWETS